MTVQQRNPQEKTPRKSSLSTRVFLAFAVVAACAFVSDTALAARAEYRLSTRLELRDNLPYSPDTYIAGFPFLAVLVTDKVPRVGVQVLDVPVEGFGLINASAEAFDIEISGAQVLAANFTGGEAAMTRRRVRLDGVAFGELLGMTDLDIANPYDMSPLGGVASEARLTGTVPGAQEPSTVVVTLRLEQGVFHMRPSKLIDVPTTDTQKVLAAFTFERDTRDLPLGGPADLVQLSGGSIEFSRDRINVTLRPEDLTPLAADKQPAT
ncbi:LmeA family phospholipid-binding protein [Corynebacterium mayonis]|uniref:LmeA family phospholipid-binding protein n=1 Tax=Corynebacterium mayonis TaxID=3062461 RepID=UPI00314086AA